MKTLKRIVLLSSLLIVLFSGCSIECKVDNIIVLNGLKNYQSIIGYTRNCGATSSYSVNVSFIHPELNIRKEHGNVFRATHTADLKIEKLTKDTIQIIFSANNDDILTKVDSIYGIKFIYKNKWEE